MTSLRRPERPVAHYGIVSNMAGKAPTASLLFREKFVLADGTTLD
jgi:hypothetical protein